MVISAVLHYFIYEYLERTQHSVFVRLCVSLLTSCERPPADGSSPFSVGRLSLGELHPETGVLLLLGEESGETHT